MPVNKGKGKREEEKERKENTIANEKRDWWLERREKATPTIAIGMHAKKEKKDEKNYNREERKEKKGKRMEKKDNE